MKTVFSDQVRNIVRSIEAGNALSYAEVAILAGKKGAARAVANVMAHNFDPTVPCHRVIKSDGTPGGYNRGGAGIKRALLIKEGYTFNT